MNVHERRTMKTKIVKPTKIIKPFDNVEIRLFGRNKGQTDWSIKDLQTSEDLWGNSPQVKTYWHIDEIARDAGLKSPRVLYAPSPTFDAKIASAKEFEGKGIQYTNPEWRDQNDQFNVILGRGVKADGCDVPKGSAFWLSSADCPTLIITDGEKVVCAHCGYKSLVDRETLWCIRGTSIRSHFSVVDAVLEQFADIDISRRVNLRAFVTLGIGPHWSEASETELEKLVFYEGLACENPRESYRIGRKKLNIVELVRCQCLNRGIGNVRTDNNDTFTNKDENENFLWWSYERAMKQSPADKLKRNGVMVIYH